MTLCFVAVGAFAQQLAVRGNADQIAAKPVPLRLATAPPTLMRFEPHRRFGGIEKPRHAREERAGWVACRWVVVRIRRVAISTDRWPEARMSYSLTTDKRRGFCAEVQVGARIGKASGEPKARTLTMALARSLGLEVDS